MSAAGLRAAATEAVLSTLKIRSLPGQVVRLPEGDEIEVRCAPRVPVEGARFFLRVEAARFAPPRGRAPRTPAVPVPARLLASWRVVPEPVAVVALDTDTGAGRMGEVHPLLARLDRERPGWERAKSVLVPVPEDLDGPALLRLAREAADEFVVFRRVVQELRRPGAPLPPGDLAGASARLGEMEFDCTMACVDLLREAGMLEEDADRSLRPTTAVAAGFARAAAHHGLGARGHLDPRIAAEAGRSAVVRVVMARLPRVADSTAARCARILCRILPVDDTDALLGLAEEE